VAPGLETHPSIVAAAARISIVRFMGILRAGRHVPDVPAIPRY